MVVRCTLCRRRLEDRGARVTCECGWRMDARCDRNHDSWCPRHGRDRWVGAVEF